MSIFSNLGRAIGWSTPSTTFPSPPPFPKTQYARALAEGQKYATQLSDILAKRRTQQLEGSTMARQIDMDRALGRRGMQDSGYSGRMQEEIQDAKRLGARDIEEERGRMSQEAVASSAAQEAEARRWYATLVHQSNLAAAQARSQRRAQQGAQRLSTIMGILGMAGDFALPQLFPTSGGGNQIGAGGGASYMGGINDMSDLANYPPAGWQSQYRAPAYWE